MILHAPLVRLDDSIKKELEMFFYDNFNPMIQLRLHCAPLCLHTASTLKRAQFDDEFHWKIHFTSSPFLSDDCRTESERCFTRTLIYGSESVLCCFGRRQVKSKTDGEMRKLFQESHTDRELSEVSRTRNLHVQRAAK